MGASTGMASSRESVVRRCVAAGRYRQLVDDVAASESAVREF
jgi:hypothetical protein